MTKKEPKVSTKPRFNCSGLIITFIVRKIRHAYKLFELEMMRIVYFTSCQEVSESTVSSKFIRKLLVS